MERFRLLERIGSGGMGTVYRAFDERLQREVAVKEISGGDPGRVLREAQAAARLNHPGIVTLYELGEQRGSAVLVSELVEGETLAELHTCGELHDREVGEIALDLCEALAHAHERGVVHRDIKPQNVIVRDQVATPQRAKLLDFGIARVNGAPTLTAAGEVVGTLAYMSPEQAEGAPVGPASDVYSLALTAYECFAGTNPVAGPTPAATARRIGEPVAPLREYRPDLPEGVADVLDACLDPDPELRPTATEVAECFTEELTALDPDNPVPLPEGSAAEAVRAPRFNLARLAALVGGAALVTLIAGPLGAGGLALLLSVLIVPLLAIGAPPTAGLAAMAPLLAAAGLGAAAPALGSATPSPLARAITGAAAWMWLVAGSIALGAGPELGFAAQAPSGWAGDTTLAADTILREMVSPASLAAAGLFAAASASLGWILSARHASIALLGAMLWAAGVEAGLGVVAGGALGGNAVIVVAAAAVAVALEFAAIRGEGTRERDHPARADADQPAASLA
jgi:hypothetical protein